MATFSSLRNDLHQRFDKRSYGAVRAQSCWFVPRAGATTAKGTALAADFVDAQRANADRPEARTTLGSFLARRGRSVDAETEYKEALQLSPQYLAASINLADLYRQLGRDSQGETVLRAAISASPRAAAAHHALGLALTRLSKPEAALWEFQAAAELEPDEVRHQYVDGLNCITLNDSKPKPPNIGAQSLECGYERNRDRDGANCGPTFQEEKRFFLLKRRVRGSWERMTVDPKTIRHVSNPNFKTSRENTIFPALKIKKR
jgi:tetratricopeptide (TPR) repeat protein